MIEEESKAKNESNPKTYSPEESWRGNYANPSVPNLASSFPEVMLLSPQIPGCSVIYGRLFCAWPACCVPPDAMSMQI